MGNQKDDIADPIFVVVNREVNVMCYLIILTLSTQPFPSF